MSSTKDDHTYVKIDAESIVPKENQSEAIPVSYLTIKDPKDDNSEIAIHVVRTGHKIKRTVKLRYLLHEIERNVLMKYHPVGKDEEDKMEEINDNLGTRDLEITDKDDPDVYAVTFYSFLMKDIDAEIASLVFKANIAFMV